MVSLDSWYAKGLFEGLQGLGWHPLLRVNAKGTFRPAGWVHRYPLTHWTPTVGAGGKDEAPRLPRKPPAWSAPCWPIGAKAIRLPG